MNHLLALCAALAIAACSGGQKTDTGKGSGATGDGSGSGSAVAAAGPITRAECETMVGHILDVGVAESRKNDPPDQQPTPDQIAEIKKKMIADEEGMKKCMAFDRPILTCVMAANDSATMNACLGPAE